jgi:hypothetical protein
MGRSWPPNATSVRRAEVVAQSRQIPPTRHFYLARKGHDFADADSGRGVLGKFMSPIDSSQVT